MVTGTTDPTHHRVRFAWGRCGVVRCRRNVKSTNGYPYNVVRPGYVVWGGVWGRWGAGEGTGAGCGEPNHVQVWGVGNGQVRAC